jgi:hypothetical protein
MAAWTTRGLKEKQPKGTSPVVCEAFRILKWGESRILAVQWHPEEIKDYELIKRFFITSKELSKPAKVDTAEAMNVI